MNKLIHNGNARMALHYYERGVAGIDAISAEEGLAALEYWIKDAVARQAAEEARINEEIEAHDVC